MNLETIKKRVESLIYLDNSATTKPYQEVLHTFVKINENLYANPSSIHSFGGKVEKLLHQAREQMASILNVQAQEIFYTSGGTEANNLAIKGAALQYRNRGKHIITSSIEHPSVLHACQQLEELGFSITYLPVNSEGRVSVEDVRNAIRKDTILVSIMHVNNEIGVIQPIKEIGAELQKYPKVLFHVDYVQGCGKVPLNFYEAHIDLCTLSAHKIHGLKGNGLLFKRKGIDISPILTGGDQERSIRSGTENVAGIVAFAKALRIHTEEASRSISHLQMMKEALREKLKQLSSIVIHTPIDGSAPHILNFSVEGFKGEVMVHALENHQIYVSTTSACSSKRSEPSKTLLAMGVPEQLADQSLRISLTFENTLDEIDKFYHALIKEMENLAPTMRRSKS